MRCVCGRVYQNRIRDLITLLVVVICLGSLLRAERERREYKQARHALVELGEAAQSVLDSIRATRVRALP